MTRSGGSATTRLRAYWRARLPLRCRRCGRLVHAHPDRGWQVGHLIDAARGGAYTPANTWPEHSTCNMSAGGRLGAAITNGRRRPAKPAGLVLAPERERGIRGWR